ncbi:MAG: response regulator [Phycisphaerae bacterium]|nr:response regulator [Phycisphaerae bacterium]
MTTTAPAAPTGASVPATVSAPDQVRVLLVDDQAIIGEAVRRMLATQPGIEYRYCQDPLKAIDMAIEFKPTVILQDLVMPGVDGLDLVRDYRAREETREIPLIVLSSKEEATTKAEAFARGANDYLVKLPDPVEVIARIRYHSKGYLALLQRNAAFKALAESERHMAEELSRAADYVRSILDPPIEGRVSTTWRFVPSASLGGDSFGYHWIDDRRFAMYLIDVCGHGVGPALLSISAMNMVRSMSPQEASDPSFVLSRLNASFQMERHNGMYFTMWYGVFDAATRAITWSGGGHPPAFLLGGPEMRLLDSQGPMIGAIPDLDWASVTTEVPEGARLILFSDGAFELQKTDGEMWAWEEFVQFMSEPPPSGVSRIDRLVEHATALQGSDQFVDDFSMVEVVFA